MSTINVDRAFFVLRKMSQKKPFPPSKTRAAEILGLVHSDVCQMEVFSHGGCRYFLTFLDNCTRMLFVYFLKHKSNTRFSILKRSQKNRQVKPWKSSEPITAVNTLILNQLNFFAKMPFCMCILYLEIRNKMDLPSVRMELFCARCMLIRNCRNIFRLKPSLTHLQLQIAHQRQHQSAYGF